jgi:hypothetical protein
LGAGGTSSGVSLRCSSFGLLEQEKGLHSSCFTCSSFSLLRRRVELCFYESMTPCAPTFFLFVVFGRCIDIIQAFCFNSFADFGFVYGSGASS